MTSPRGLKILRRREVILRTGLSGPTIWRRMRGGKFPQCVQLGPGAVGWLEHEIDAYLENLPRGPIPLANINCRDQLVVSP